MTRIFRFILRQPFTIAACVYLLVNGVTFMARTHVAFSIAGHGIQFDIGREDSEWEDVFVLAARRLTSGLNIYELVPESRGHAFSYPPLQAMLAIPFTYLSKNYSRFVWMLINWLAAACLWRFSWRASGGKKLEGKEKLDLTEAGICVLGLVCAARFVEDCLDHQQTDLVIGALLMAGVLAWQRSRSILAASLWGISAAFKGPPLLFVPYLAWRGRWIAAIWMLILAIGLNLLPDLVHRAPSGLWIQQWHTQMLAPVDQVGRWYTAPENNQSIAGEAYRSFGDTVSPHNLKLAVYGLEFLLLAAAAFAMGRFLKPSADAYSTALECALVMCLFLLLSPMSSKPHFCILLLTGFLLARQSILRGGIASLLSILAAIVLFDLVDRNVAGKPIGEWMMSHGSVMWGTAALGVGCMVTLLCRERQPSHRVPMVTA